MEHRYYGCHNRSSCPYTQPTPRQKHLKYLTSRQALADLSAFQTYATQQYALGAETKWVVWGGSYPGMLTAWTRALYPDQFHAAVASSAPVNVVLDMISFNDIVATAYANATDPGIFGSAACAQAISAGHASIGSALKSNAGRVKVQSLFPDQVPSPEWLENKTNAAAFCGCGVAYFPAQTNDPTCTTPACGIKQICEIMTNTSTGSPVQRLAALAAVQQTANMKYGCEMDWTANDIPDAPVNYWGYQTCNEFGFYQSCDLGSECFYTQGLIGFNDQTVAHRPNDFCAEQFGIETAATTSAIAVSNKFYSAKVASATRIFWPNGDVVSECVSE